MQVSELNILLKLALYKDVIWLNLGKIGKIIFEMHVGELNILDMLGKSNNFY